MLRANCETAEKGVQCKYSDVLMNNHERHETQAVLKNLYEGIVIDRLRMLIYNKKVYREGNTK